MKTTGITYEILNEWFYYDPSSPSFLRWKRDVSNGRYNRCLAKDITGSLARNKNGYNYWLVTLFGIRLKAHRVVWMLHNKQTLDRFTYVDHKDKDTANNSVENLRAVSPRINSQNRKVPSTSKTGVIGVYYKENKRLFAATWYFEGSPCVKYFSVAKLGYDKAFSEACKFREEMISKLNQEGQHYTDNHGDII